MSGLPWRAVCAACTAHLRSRSMILELARSVTSSLAATQPHADAGGWSLSLGGPVMAASISTARNPTQRRRNHRQASVAADMDHHGGNMDVAGSSTTMTDSAAHRNNTNSSAQHLSSRIDTTYTLRSPQHAQTHASRIPMQVTPLASKSISQDPNRYPRASASQQHAGYPYRMHRIDSLLHALLSAVSESLNCLTQRNALHFHSDPGVSSQDSADELVRLRQELDSLNRRIQHPLLTHHLLCCVLTLCLDVCERLRDTITPYTASSESTGSTRSALIISKNLSRRVCKLACDVVSHAFLESTKMTTTRKPELESMERSTHDLVVVFEHILALCFSTQRADLAYRMYTEAEQNDVRPSLGCLHAMVTILSSCHKHKDAGVFIKRITAHVTDHLDEFAGWCTEVLGSHAKHLLAPHPRAVQALLDLCYRNRWILPMESLLCALRARRGVVWPSHVTKVMQSHLRDGDPSRAVQVYMDVYRENKVVGLHGPFAADMHTTVIKALLEMDRVDAALIVLARLKQSLDETSSPQVDPEQQDPVVATPHRQQTGDPNTHKQVRQPSMSRSMEYVYSIFIDYMASRGQMNDAVQLFKEAKSVLGGRMGSGLYGTIIKAISMHDADLDYALDVYTAVFSDKNAVMSTQATVRPTARMMAGLITRFAASGRSTDVHGFIDDANRFGLTGDVAVADAIVRALDKVSTCTDHRRLHQLAQQRPHDPVVLITVLTLSHDLSISDFHHLIDRVETVYALSPRSRQSVVLVTTLMIRIARHDRHVPETLFTRLKQVVERVVDTAHATSLDNGFFVACAACFGIRAGRDTTWWLIRLLDRVGMAMRPAIASALVSAAARSCDVGDPQCVVRAHEQIDMLMDIYVTGSTGDGNGDDDSGDSGRTKIVMNVCPIGVEVYTAFMLACARSNDVDTAREFWRSVWKPNLAKSPDCEDNRHHPRCGSRPIPSINTHADLTTDKLKCGDFITSYALCLARDGRREWHGTHGFGYRLLSQTRRDLSAVFKDAESLGVMLSRASLDSLRRVGVRVCFRDDEVWVESVRVRLRSDVN